MMRSYWIPGSAPFNPMADPENKVADSPISLRGEPPIHVAIIPDGNGRWARKQGLTRHQGHRHGVENVHRILRRAADLGIRYLTLYAFSVENWRRPRQEVELLMKLLHDYLTRNIDELVENRIRLSVIGRPHDLSSGLQRLIRRAEQSTAEFHEHTFVLALNYGSRSETVDAVKRYAQAVEQGREDPTSLNWDRFAQYLYTAEIPDPDLIIRTSGETRLSNFLLLQGAYAEYYFSEKFWPDFGPDDLVEAIACFRKRERRFGKTGEQVRRGITEVVVNS